MKQLFYDFDILRTFNLHIVDLQFDIIPMLRNKSAHY